MPETQFTYLDSNEPFKPSCSLKAAIVSGWALMPSINDAGSPGIISITAKITTLAAIKLSDREINRVKANWSIFICH